MMEEKEAWQVWVLNLPGLAWYWRRIEDGQGSNSSWMLERCDCKEWCRPGHLLPVVTEGCEGGLRVAENDGVLGLQVQLYWQDILQGNISQISL